MTRPLTRSQALAVWRLLCAMAERSEVPRVCAPEASERRDGRPESSRRRRCRHPQTTAPEATPASAEETHP
jgi:hypothetical protein